MLRLVTNGYSGSHCMGAHNVVSDSFQFKNEALTGLRTRSEVGHESDGQFHFVQRGCRSDRKYEKVWL